MSESGDRDFRPMDERMRNSLESFRTEPSEKVWKGMNRKLLWMEVARFNFTNVPLFYKVAVPAMLFALLGTGIYLTRDDMPPAPPAAVTATEPAVTPAETERPAEVRTQTQVQAVAHAQKKSQAEAREIYAATERIATETTGESREDMPAGYSQLPVAPAPSRDNPVEGISPYGFDAFENANAPDILAVDNPVPPDPDLRLTSDIITNRIPHSLGLGADLSPDMVFYKNTSDYFKYSYSFDVSAQYSVGRFYVQGGIGIGYSSDIGNYDVSYVRNDSVGFYYQVTSFYRDDGNPDRILFDIDKVTIFDSNQYYYQYNTENSYLYLQFPVSVGFRAVTAQRWSLSAEAGAVYSYLVWKNEPEPNFYAPDSRVMEVKRIDPLRLSGNFAVTAGVRFDYHVARRLDLMIMPDFKYYINAIEGIDGAKVDQPWSVGLKVGVWYRFDLKSR
jgi:hypothetical protein